MSELVPKLRFKNFNAKWEVTTLNNISLKITDGTHDTPKKTSNGFPFITAAHVNDGSIDFENSYYVSEHEHRLIYKRCNPELNDILVVNIGAGTATTALVDVNFEFSLKNVALLKLNKDIVNPKFISQVLRFNSKKWFHQLTSGGAQPFLSLKEIGRYKLIYGNKQEQQKIADFLSSVDTKISQLTEKHRLLKEYKKGAMQQIFSQQIRFKGEDGKEFPEWKTYTLRQILSLQSDSLNMQDDETYELITVKRGFGGVVSRGLFKGKDVLVKNQFTIHENEFVISKRQIVHGACGIAPPELEGAIVSNEYNVFRPVEKLLDIDYFNRFATTPLMRRAFFINSDGVHIEKLLFKTQSWLKTKVELPCLAEQQKISKFLKALDQKIESVEKQIEQTKQFKKGLLQQMFV